MPVISLGHTLKLPVINNQLDKRIHELSSCSDVGTPHKVANLPRKTERLDLQKMNGARIRAKELQISFNENFSSYFFHLENKGKARKVITKLTDNNDTR